MATFLDVTTLQSFSVIFVFVFVVLVIYAILLYTKVFGRNQFINLAVGVLFAFFVIMSDLATTIIKKIAPIFAVILVLVAIVSMASKSLGPGTNVDSSLKWVVMIVLVVALIVGAMSVVRDNIDVPETGDDYSKTSTVIFHPKFLGIILIFMIAVFTVGLLATKKM